MTSIRDARASLPWSPLVLVLAVGMLSSAEGFLFQTRNGGMQKPLIARHHETRRCYMSDSFKDAPLSTLVDLPSFVLAPTDEDVMDLKEGQRLVCLGDVHGDLEGLRHLLELSGVVNPTGNGDRLWVGGNTILVQCGDVLDRGSEELACYSLLSRLSHEAKEAGGKVILLYGNHEALNAMGMFQYSTTDQEYEHVVGREVDQALDSTSWRHQYVGNQPARWATYEPGGLLSQTLMANMKVAVKIGRTVCVHAGLKPEHLERYDGIEGMNQQAKAWIANKQEGVQFNNVGEYPVFNQQVVEVEARQQSYVKTIPPVLKGGTDSPIWMRDYSFPHDAHPKNPDAQSMIDGALRMVDCDRMVMGHTVQRRINNALEGKAWRVDVGVSRGVVGGVPEVLEIVKVNGEELVSVLTPAGKLLPEERRAASAVRPSELWYFTEGIDEESILNSKMSSLHFIDGIDEQYMMARDMNEWHFIEDVVQP